MNLFNSWLVNKYVAHRGLHNETAPENSLKAFKNAIEHDYTIELDVHPLEDGTPVVFHDETLKRLTGEDGYISKIKNVEELKTFKILETKQTIPTLQEVLDVVKNQVPVIIEIKDFNINGIFENAIYEVLKNYTGDYAVMSFNPYSLKWFKENAPEVLRGQMASLFKGKKLGIFRKWALKRMTLNKSVSQPNFIVYKWDEIPNKYVKKYKHLPLIATAVPSQQDYMKVAQFCDNIIFENFEPRI